jgi:predicted transcriptional regulator
MRQSTFRVPRLLPGFVEGGRMTVSEQALVELRTRLEGVLGTKEAATLMDHLPRDRAATKADLQALEKTTGDWFEAVDRRFEAVDRRFDEVEHRFSVLDIRLEELEKRLDERIDARSEILEHRVLGALSGVREDFATQLNVQTRIFVFSTISALLTLAALTLALSGA